MVAGTGLFVEDHLPLHLVHPDEGALPDYRMRMLAGSGDIVVQALSKHAVTAVSTGLIHALFLIINNLNSHNLNA